MKNELRLDGKPLPTKEQIVEVFERTRNLNAVAETFNLNYQPFLRYARTLGIYADHTPGNKVIVKSVQQREKKYTKYAKTAINLLKHKTSLSEEEIQFLNAIVEKNRVNKHEITQIKEISKRIASQLITIVYHGGACSPK